MNKFLDVLAWVIIGAVFLFILGLMLYFAFIAFVPFLILAASCALVGLVLWAIFRVT